MKNLYFYILCFLCCSCFEVTEKVKHNANQSGEYSLTVDFSESWLKVKSAILLKTVDGVTIPSEEDIIKKFANFRSKASKIKGTSKIYTSYDFNNYVFKLNFAYNSIETLNAVLNSLEGTHDFVHFKSANNEFTRVASYPLPKNLVKNEKRKEELLTARIQSIYIFEKEVNQATNSRSKIFSSKKTVSLTQKVWNVLNNRSLMNNTITLTP